LFTPYFKIIVLNQSQLLNLIRFIVKSLHQSIDTMSLKHQIYCEQQLALTL